MSTIVDLTYTMKPHWRWHFEPELQRSHGPKEHFLVHFFTTSCHSFTHVDAPLHFVPGGKTLAELPLTQWVGEAAVVHLAPVEPEQAIDAPDLERAGAHVREGDIVLLRTDWPRRCDVMSREFWGVGPYITREACEWLVERGVRTVGYDFPTDYILRYAVTDPEREIKKEECTTHDVLLPRGICQVEYMTNLHLLEGRSRVQVYILPLSVEGVEGCPARAIAVLD